MVQEPPPTTWEDLVSPAFAGKLGIVQVGGSGVNQALIDFLIRHFGEGYLRQMATLSPRIFDTAAVQSEALARGELAGATLGLSTGLEMERSGAPVKMVIPEAGTSGAYTPLGLTPRGVENPAAQVFLNWQLSKSGQKFSAALGLVPARSDIGPQVVDGYVLPTPTSDTFEIFTREDQKQRRASVIEAWKSIFNYTA